MGLLRSVAAVVLILAALSACGGGEGAASDGVLHGNSGTTTSSGGARLLFSSGFEGSIALSAPSLYGNGGWQDIRRHRQHDRIYLAGQHLGRQHQHRS